MRQAERHATNRAAFLIWAITFLRPIPCTKRMASYRQICLSGQWAERLRQRYEDISTNNSRNGSTGLTILIRPTNRLKSSRRPPPRKQTAPSLYTQPANYRTARHPARRNNDHMTGESQDATTSQTIVALIQTGVIRAYSISLSPFVVGAFIVRRDQPQSR